MSNLVHLLAIWASFASAAVALSILTIVGRQAALCAGSVMALGSYGLVGFLLNGKTELAIVAILALLLLVIVLSALFIILEDDRFVLSTLLLQQMIIITISNMQNLTGGVRGLVIDHPLASHGIFALAGICLLVICLAVHYWLDRGYLRQEIQVVISAPELAATHGRQELPVKALLVLLTLGLMTVAGSNYAMVIGYIHPSAFADHTSLMLLAIVLLSGTRNPLGLIPASICVVMLPESLRFMSASPAVVGHIREMLFGLCLLVASLGWSYARRTS